MKLPWRHHRQVKTRGQALVEFALILPLLALATVMALDVGRVFFGWVGIQNVARVAAGYAAANPDGWDPNVPNSVIKQAKVAGYNLQVAAEASGLNCSPLPVALPTPANMPTPVFADANGNSRYDLGETVTVTVSCSMGLITPLASSVIGGNLNLSSQTVFTIRAGTIAGIPVSSSIPSASASPSASSSASASPSASASASVAPCPLPIANFNATPTTGKKTLRVTFNDTSQTFGCAVTGWVWDFGDGDPISTVQNPVHDYDKNGTYSVRLTVTSPGGVNSVFNAGYITVCGNC